MLINPNGAIAFDITGPTTGGVALANSSTINITQGGDYSIFVLMTVSPLSTSEPENIEVGLLINNIEIPDFKTNTTISNSDSNGLPIQFSIDAIVSIPDNSTLQLRNLLNNSFTINSNSVNSGTIKIIKLN
ncbi:hypothetical protein C2W64_00897 [Brevibacillus laterosporus]|nr:hypothetical protein C2W64_00897 [Brevibacillus laterosporus]